jgi:tyrosyl-tRNA synthetase
VPTFIVSKDQIAGGLDALTLLSESAKVFPSKGDARRSLQENAVSINKAKVTLETKITTDQLLKGKYIIAQKGKKNYYLIIAE